MDRIREKAKTKGASDRVKDRELALKSEAEEKPQVEASSASTCGNAKMEPLEQVQVAALGFSSI